MSEHQFQKKQQQFINAIRMQNAAENLTIEPERMALYQDLIFTTNSEIMRTAFPVLYAVLGEKQWRELIKSYLRDFKNPTTIFHEIPKYFVAYLKDSNKVSLDLLELAHYEWLELHVSLMDCEYHFFQTKPQSLSEVADLIPKTNASLQLMQYSHPVHEMRAADYPPTAKPTFLAVYRDESMNVKFTLLNHASANLLLRFKTNSNKTLRELGSAHDATIDLEDESNEFVQVVKSWIDDAIIENFHK